MKVWTNSKSEEVISALWFVAGFAAHSAGFHGVGSLFVLKASLDFICAIYFAVKEAWGKGE